MPIVQAKNHNIEADALFMAIGDGAISTDENGNISRINAAALKILGKEKQNLIGKWFLGEIVAVDQDGAKIEPLERAITRSMINGKSITERSFYKHQNGKNIPVSVTVSPLIVDDRPIGAVEVFRDITAEYEIDKLKSEFISIASHQLRTPATAVKNFIGLLREGFAGKLTKEQTELIDHAYVSNEHQLEIVNNLLYVARADSDQVNLRLLENDYAELVNNCINEQAQVIEERRQSINKDIPGTLPAVFDRQFLHMLIENLLTNASKYTPDGGTITVTLEDRDTSSRLVVSDTGVGIAIGDQLKLFQRFSRIDNELSTLRGGSGIGLYLVKRIVELHHGKVSVSSKPGKGTSFTVILPKEAKNG